MSYPIRVCFECGHYGYHTPGCPEGYDPDEEDEIESESFDDQEPDIPDDCDKSQFDPQEKLLAERSQNNQDKMR
jgi:hypothetical protein